MKFDFMMGSAGVIGKSTSGIPLECGGVCAHTGARLKTFEAAAPANSFTNTRRCPLNGGSCWARAGGPKDYTANLGTDRGHLCPSKKARGLESHAGANERRTAEFFFFLFFWFWGGGRRSTCLKAVPSLVQASIARRHDKFGVSCVWARGAPSRPCRLNDRRRMTAECDCSCAVCVVVVEALCV